MRQCIKDRSTRRMTQIIHLVMVFLRVFLCNAYVYVKNQKEKRNNQHCLKSFGGRGGEQSERPDFRCLYRPWRNSGYCVLHGAVPGVNTGQVAPLLEADLGTTCDTLWSVRRSGCLLGVFWGRCLRHEDTWTWSSHCDPEKRWVNILWKWGRLMQRTDA